MARYQNRKSLRTGKYVIIGAGLTERYYFAHLKHLIDLSVDIRPRLFGRENIAAIQKRIEEVTAEKQIAICVFDADVSTWNDVERQRLAMLKVKYRNSKYVHIFTSLPSVEYWFLLHFENTNRFLPTSHEAIVALHKYMPSFDKTIDFLEKDQWVRLLLADNRLAIACQRAEQFAQQTTTQDSVSYSELYKLFNILFPNK